MSTKKPTYTEALYKSEAEAVPVNATTAKKHRDVNTEFLKNHGDVICVSVVGDALSAETIKLRKKNMDLAFKHAALLKLSKVDNLLVELVDGCKDHTYMTARLQASLNSVRSLVESLNYVPPHPKRLPNNCWYSYDAAKGPGVCVCDIEGPGDRGPNSRCPWVRAADGCMCRSDCAYYYTDQETAQKYISRGLPITNENTTSGLGSMVHVYEAIK